MPSAIAAKEPRPAPRPTASVDVPEGEGAAVTDALGEESSALAAVGFVEGVFVAVADDVMFLKAVDEISVGIEYMDPKIDAVANISGFFAVNSRSGMVQQVWFVRFTRPS